MRDFVPYLVVLLGACTAQGGADAAPVDTALPRCDASQVRAGCPCDGTIPTVCGDPDYICSAGTWVVAANVCGERDAGAHADDANDGCDDEGGFTCIGGSTVCCNGHRRAFVDGPCGFIPPNDAGTADCPNAFGCACDIGSTEAPCIGDVRAFCTSSGWQPGNHVCGAFCASLDW